MDASKFRIALLTQAAAMLIAASIAVAVVCFQHGVAIGLAIGWSASSVAVFGMAFASVVGGGSAVVLVREARREGVWEDKSLPH